MFPLSRLPLDTTARVLRLSAAEPLRAGALNGRIEEVYGCTAPQTEQYAERLVKVTEGFAEAFPENPGTQM